MKAKMTQSCPASYSALWTGKKKTSGSSDFSALLFQEKKLKLITFSSIAVSLLFSLFLLFQPAPGDEYISSIQSYNQKQLQLQKKLERQPMVNEKWNPYVVPTYFKPGK